MKSEPRGTLPPPFFMNASPCLQMLEVPEKGVCPFLKYKFPKRPGELLDIYILICLSLNARKEHEGNALRMLPMEGDNRQV